MSGRLVGGVLLLFALVASSVGAQESAWAELRLESVLVPSPVEVGILLPPGYDAAGPPLPLVLFLHGGGGSMRFLAQCQALIESAWASGDLPPAVFVTPSAGRSFYMDYRDGSESWESSIMTELLSELRSLANISRCRCGIPIRSTCPSHEDK